MASSRKTRFGFETVDEIPTGKALYRRRTTPMSAAVRETTESVRKSTQALIAVGRKNAADARDYREAVAAGLVLSRIPLDEISTDDLPRDRLDLAALASSNEMDELKSSIRVHGQKEPIEVYNDDAGAFQLKKGWRRLTALRMLHRETGEGRFATALARVDGEVTDRLRHYVDMVEENVLREDLTFAEMAQLAIEAALDPSIEGKDPEDLVNRLYASLHKMKRSYIRSFMQLLNTLGDDLQFPKAVRRDLGVDVARTLREHPELVGGLKRELAVCRDAESQEVALRALIERRVMPKPPAKKAPDSKGQRYEFHVGSAKVTVRRGEFRIKDDTDFTDVSRERLEEAVAAFQAVLRGT